MEDEAVQLLIQCAESDDGDRWRRFERFFRPRLLAGIRRALGRAQQAPDPELTRELLQETYCRLLDRDRRILRAFSGRTDGEACAYLMRVAQSVTLDRLRGRATAKRGAGFTLIRGTTAETLGRDVSDPSPTPERLAIGRDIWDRFWKRCALVSGSREPGRDLDILQLALFQGWTSREIAAAKELPISTVDTVVHRLRRRLARRGLALPPRPGAAREVAEGPGVAGDRRS